MSIQYLKNLNLKEISALNTFMRLKSTSVTFVMFMEKTEKILALLTLVLAVTFGISFWMSGVSDPQCYAPA